LTRRQYQLVFVKLVEDANFHDVLTKFERRQFERRDCRRTVRRVVVRATDDTGNGPVMARACITSVGATVYRMGICVPGALLMVASQPSIFSISSALTVYSWSKGQIGWKNALKDIGSHATGFLGGLVGSVAG